MRSLKMNLATGEKTWLTPKYIIDELGPFDLDPCAADSMPWPTAKRMVTKAEDGLSIPWDGFVWCNPPYGHDSVPFLERMVEHDNGLLLIFSRTETSYFQDLVLGGGQIAIVCSSEN